MTRGVFCNSSAKDLFTVMHLERVIKDVIYGISEAHLWQKCRGQFCCIYVLSHRNINFEVKIIFLKLKYRARICKRLWSPEIDSDESISPAYVVWWSGLSTTNTVVVPARQAGNRFLSSWRGFTNTGSVHRRSSWLHRFFKHLLYSPADSWTHN